MGRATLLATSRGPIEVAVAGSGAPLLLLHGTGGGFDQGIWLGHVLGLDGVRVISVSRPGYLGTPDRPTIEDAVDLYTAMLDALGIDRVMVLGASGGGLSAIALAARRPDRVQALLMISAVSGRVVPPGPAAMISWTVGTMIDANVAILTSALRSERRSAVAELAGTLTAPHRRIAGSRRDLRLSSIFAMPEISGIPTFVVHGTKDRVVPFAHALRTAESCAGATLVPIAGGGHLCCLTHAEVREKTRAFLAAID